MSNRDRPHRGASPAVLVTGGSGFIGRALTEQLAAAGYRCYVVSRTPERAQRMLPAGVQAISYDAGWPAVEAVINMAGESVAGLWTPAKRRRILESRIGATRRVVAYLQQANPRPATLLSMSAVGYYGNRPDERLVEAAPPDPENKFRAQVTRAWEAEAWKATELGVRVVLLRVGNVLHPAGGYLHTLLRFYRFLPLVGFGPPEPVFPWISRRDAVRLMQFSLETAELAGPLHVTAPQPVSQGTFVRELAAVLQRRVWGHLPGWVLRLVLGDFSAILLDSQAVYPERALAAGFRFLDPELRPFLQRLLARSATDERG